MKILLILLLCSCSYGIKEQRQLAEYSHRANKTCKADKTKCKDSEECIKAAYEGIHTIQQAQVNKANKRSTSVDEYNSTLSYKGAINKCRQF